MTERQRWVLLVLALVASFGGLAGSGIIYTNSVDRHTRVELTRVQDDRQRDLCELMRVFDDPAAPPPTTERGAAQATAIRDYLRRRCS